MKYGFEFLLSINYYLNTPYRAVKNKLNLGPLGGEGSVDRLTLGFSSDHDLRVVRSSPLLGSVLCRESA